MIRIVAIAVALAILVMPGLRAQGLDVTGLLATYSEGRYDDAVARVAALPDLGPFRLRFVQDTPRWVNADPARIDARSAAAAAFLLEVAAARVESDWGRVSDLIEYTCIQLLRGFERAQRRDDRDTAVSLIDRVFNRSTGTADPGRLVGYGSFMRWPALKTAMRKALP